MGCAAPEQRVGRPDQLCAQLSRSGASTMTRSCNGLVRIAYAVAAYLLQAGARGAMAAAEALLKAADSIGRKAAGS